MLSAPRIGCVRYLNARPLIHGWKGPVRFDHPSVLCRELAAGDLDLALVSSFEFLRHPIYSAVDGISIASDGAVYSVFLAHRKPVEELEEVALDPASETSVNLLRCLLAEEFHVAPKLVTAGELTDKRGRLLIGDHAIQFRQNIPADVQILDLGAAWKKLGRLPFVYALWLIRPEFPDKKKTAAELRHVAAENLRNLERLIADQRAADHAFLRFYYRECLRFNFGAAEKAGLRKFGELCARQNLLPANPAPPALV